MWGSERCPGQTALRACRTKDSRPSPGTGGVASVSGHRGPVGFFLQMTYQRPGATRSEDFIDLSARAEAAARRAASDWTAWLEGQLAAG